MHILAASADIWGDVPAWISAIGTVGALWVAMWLLFEDLKDRRASREADKQRVARRLSGWCEVKGDKAILWIQNLSEEPAYDVVGYVGKTGTNLESLPDPDNVYMEPVFGVVPPGQKLDFKIDDRRFFASDIFPDIPAVAIEFTDANGLHWRRLANGELKNIPHRRPFD
jgi:hypothetical protein